MGLQAAATHKHEEERRPNRRPWASWRLALIATVGAVLMVTQFSTYTHHFHAHVAKHRILRSLQEQPALRLTFELKRAATATHLLEPGVVEEKCPGGSMMVFPFAGEDFVLCSRPSSSSWFKDEGFQIFGSDLNINVKYESTAPMIVAPRVASSVLDSCKKVPFGERITPSLPSLMTRSVSEWGHRALRAEKAEWNIFKKAWNLITDNVCGCKGAQRPCVFIAGLSSYDDYGLTDNDPKDYFGSEIALFSSGL
ncbi:hypothetical protein PF006_g7062 [Phytophthora fragariae]|uniref:Uncharacterized protein n=1 Tax=Phytophthora fragariae TaxID=53985 RepID=A0A6A3UEB1_9STRA|nr:hypothetical protein PF006_g7062 [Phytophthora fragariae]